MKLFILVIFTIFSTLSFTGKTQCTVDLGQRDVTNDQNVYQISFSELPKNTCYPLVDSHYIAITVYCEGYTEKLTMASTDTLKIEINNSVIIFMRVVWVRPNGSKSVTIYPPLCLNDGAGEDCFNIIEDVIPPASPVVPSITLENYVITSNIPGVLVVVTYPSYTPILVIDFAQPFEYNFLFTTPQLIGLHRIYMVTSSQTYDLGVVDF
jgi:hypothetical protein